MGFYGILMGLNGILMGYSWDIPLFLMGKSIVNGNFQWHFFLKQEKLGDLPGLVN